LGTDNGGLKQNEKNRDSADTQPVHPLGTITAMFNSFPKGAPP
jgi:hypothetical protein